MASIEQKGTNTPPNFRLDPSKYEALGDIVNAAAVAKPDVRDMLVKTYGDQGITGFLNLTGAVKNAGTSDEINWFEEGRRHVKFAHGGSSATTPSHAITIAEEAASTDPADIRKVQENDVIMDVTTGRRFLVTARDTAATSFTATDLGGDTTNLSAGHFIVIGNMYAQGTDQPKYHTETEAVKYTNSYAIVKDIFTVNGSQATNVGYVNVGNGDYRWYIHGENETRARFLDRREMTLLFGQKTYTDNAAVASLNGGIVGTEGYFSALEKRGLVVSGANTSPLDSIAEFDSIIIELDKQGAPAEYAMYLNRKQSLAIDDMLAAGIATSVTAGLPGQFGAFNNSADMAIQLGFKSFTRGGYTFHKHDWKLLNDPTLLGASNVYQGAMVPLSQVVDPRNGNRAPSLELNYKAANGYSREMEHWVTGGGVLGYNQNGVDAVEFNYRSEVALVVRAANQHVAIKG